MSLTREVAREPFLGQVDDDVSEGDEGRLFLGGAGLVLFGVLLIVGGLVQHELRHGITRRGGEQTDHA